MIMNLNIYSYLVFSFFHLSSTFLVDSNNRNDSNIKRIRNESRILAGQLETTEEPTDCSKQTGNFSLSNFAFHNVSILNKLICIKPLFCCPIL